VALQQPSPQRQQQQQCQQVRLACRHAHAHVQEPPDTLDALICTQAVCTVLSSIWAWGWLVPLCCD
jgi:hypothetical protein